MTKEDIHEAIKNSSEEDRIKFVVSCQMQGMTPQEAEEMLASVGRFFESLLPKTLEYMDYYK